MSLYAGKFQAIWVCIGFKEHLVLSLMLGSCPVLCVVYGYFAEFKFFLFVRENTMFKDFVGDEDIKFVCLVSYHNGWLIINIRSFSMMCRNGAISILGMMVSMAWLVIAG